MTDRSRTIQEALVLARGQVRSDRMMLDAVPESQAVRRSLDRNLVILEALENLEAQDAE